MNNKIKVQLDYLHKFAKQDAHKPPEMRRYLAHIDEASISEWKAARHLYKAMVSFERATHAARDADLPSELIDWLKKSALVLAELRRRAVEPKEWLESDPPHAASASAAAEESAPAPLASVSKPFTPRRRRPSKEQS